MINGQLRTRGVGDPRVLALYRQLRREDFMPPAYRELALADVSIPLGHGRCCLTPASEALLLQALAIRPDDDILEVGTGTGWFTALLAMSGGHVHSIDCFAEFTAAAAANLGRSGITGVELHSGEEIPAAAGFDVIALTCSTPASPVALRRRLKPAGRMALIVGRPPAMQATLVTRTGSASWQHRVLFETNVPNLHGTQPRQPFRF